MYDHGFRKNKKAVKLYPIYQASIQKISQNIILDLPKIDIQIKQLYSH